MALRKDAEKEKHRLKEQLAEVDKHERESEERENAVRDSVGDQLKFVSFEDNIDDQIKAFVSHATMVYNVFDAVLIDPQSCSFSLNDTLFQCYILEENIDEEQAIIETSKSVDKFRKRRSKSSKDEVLHANRKLGTFLPYVDLCRYILTEKKLSVIPKAIIQLSAHAISPSPTFILALMHRLRDIATGKLNIVLVGCILGIDKTFELENYLAQLKTWNSKNQLCQEKVSDRTKKRKTEVCGRRVNMDKDKCSYHIKRSNR